MVALRLIGIDANEQSAHADAANMVRDVLFGDINYPKLKSAHVVVKNDPAQAQPMYCAGVKEETIILKSPGNAPWQYSYQLAHEFGHMSARADLRFPRADGLMWIEEVLADCHSLIALDRMGKIEGRLKDGAKEYLQILLGQHNGELIDKSWYRTHAKELEDAKGLTDACQALSRHIYAQVDHGVILRDNRLLLDVATGLMLDEFLNQWNGLSGANVNVPSTLMALL